MKLKLGKTAGVAVAVKKKASKKATKKVALKKVSGKPLKAVTAAEAAKPTKVGSKKVTGKKRVPVVVGKAVVPMSPVLEKAIARVDAAQEKVTSAEEAHKAALVTLKSVLGDKTSFKHPKLGYLSVMKRGDRVYWRPKPNGHG